MTEVPDTANLAAEQFIDEIEDWPELSRCQITYLINVKDVDHLGEALDVAATSLIRYGMDAFYIMATDPDTGREWLIHNGEIVDQETLDADFQAALDEEAALEAEEWAKNKDLAQSLGEMARGEYTVRVPVAPEEGDTNDGASEPDRD